MTPHLSRPLSKAFCLLSMAALAYAPAAMAGTTSSKQPAAVSTPEPESSIHALLQLDFSDHYITPRGLDVENRGMVFQTLFLVFWDMYSDKNGFLEDITLTGGVWSSFHTKKSGANPGYWNEFDPIAGLAFKFAKYWKLETNYTAFDSMVDSYPTSSHFEAKLSFNDSSFMPEGFSLNPFVAFWQELDNKATVTFNSATSNRSHYFTVGIDPTFKIGAVKVEIPTYINIVGKDFYQKFDGTGGGSGVAVFGSEIKFSVPLTFIPKDLGSWSFYAGVKYYHLSNDGLRDGNLVLTAHEHKDDLVQYHGGISIFF